MVVINNVDSQKFSFNGVEYFKNFTPVVVGNKIRVLNTYDSSIELTDTPRLFSEFQVNGITYLNVTDLQSALLPILYTRSTLGGGGGAVDSVNGQTGVVVLDSNDIPQVYQTISANTTLDDSYHSATVWVTATCNITIPTGLRSDFYCNIRTFAGATATYITSGTVINTESDGDVQEPSTMINISTFSTNNFILSGGGLS